MRKFALGLAGLLWAAAVCTALAAAPAVPTSTGKAVGVDPSAEADFNNATRTLIVGSDVSMGETVVTGPTGQVQLLFSDQTKLLVGPKSSLLIEAYLLRPDNSVSQFSVDALAGTFRFITGKSAKNAYRIDTPTGMIGVRGTQFDFNVDTDTTLVLFEGAVRMCNLDNKCVDVTDTCGVGTMGGDDSAIMGPKQQAKENLRSKFPYVQSDAGLLPDFRAEGSDKCLLPPAASTAQPAAIVPVKPIHPKPPLKPTGTKPPVRVTHKPPVVVFDPCANFDHLRRSEQLEVRRQYHVECGPLHPMLPPDAGTGSLIGNSLRFPPPDRPRRGGSDGDGDGDSGSSDGGGSGIIY